MFYSAIIHIIAYGLIGLAVLAFAAMLLGRPRKLCIPRAPSCVALPACGIDFRLQGKGLLKPLPQFLPCQSRQLGQRPAGQKVELQDGSPDRFRGRQLPEIA